MCEIHIIKFLFKQHITIPLSISFFKCIAIVLNYMRIFITKYQLVEMYLNNIYYLYDYNYIFMIMIMIIIKVKRNYNQIL
jgi:hypothetical protein